MTAAPPPSATGEAATSSSLPDPSEWGEAVVEPRPSPVVEHLFRRQVGLVPTVVPHICPHGWAYRPFLFLMRPDVREIDASLCSQICFVVARDNACRFCYGSFHTFLRVAGYSEAELDQLEQELHLNGQSSPQHEALQFAVQLSQGRLEATPTLQSLREAGYTPPALRETADVAVLVVLANRIGTMLAVPINEETEELTAQWYFDLLQPVVQGLLRGWQGLAGTAAAPLQADDADGPFAPWSLYLEGTCAGRVVHEVTARWLEDESALPLRTKLLALAVVARGLYSNALARRSRALLSRRFDLSPDVLETAVKYLRGDAVRNRDAAVLRLARASIRYDAGDIQRTVREHVRDLSRAEIIDTVATLGLANALARLRALAPLP